MIFKFGLIVVKKTQNLDSVQIDDILHFCGYEDEITDRKKMKILKDDLYRELRDDEEFGLTETLEDCSFFICTDEILEYYNLTRMNRRLK